MSLYSALQYHGIIEQIPSVVYAVTTGRTQRIETPAATPEKALVDTLYLRPARSNLFRKLPEAELHCGVYI